MSIKLDRDFYIPTDQEVERQEIPEIPGSLVVTYERNEKYFLKTWHGKAQKPDLNYYYQSASARDKALESWKKNQVAVASFKAEQKEKRKAQAREFAEKLFTGTILYTSWGYDQTNIDFYQVTRRSGLRVWVRPIAARQVKEGAFMSGDFRPNQGEFTGPETQHTISGPYVRFSNFEHASIWDGREKHATWYA